MFTYKKTLKKEQWYGYACHEFLFTVKPVLSGHSKRRQKVGFQDRLM